MAYVNVPKDLSKVMLASGDFNQCASGEINQNPVG